MLDLYQKTLGEPVKFSGVGLHTGLPVSIEVLPAPENHGIVFRRSDVIDSEPLAAQTSNVTSTHLATVLGGGSSKISTIEHLMATFFGLGIDNVTVLVHGPEIPILDGSAACFVESFQKAGLVQQNGRKSFYLVKKPFEVGDQDQCVRVEPSYRLQFKYAINFPGIIGHQNLDFNFAKSSFLDICAARTFCHIKQVEAMKTAGYALGGSLDNAVVVTDTGYLNQNGLRYKDEFVRHKLLDALGDMALFGTTIIGKFSFLKSGHNWHFKFISELFKKKSDYLILVEPKQTSSESNISDFLESLIDKHLIPV